MTASVAEQVAAQFHDLPPDERQARFTRWLTEVAGGEQILREWWYWRRPSQAEPLGEWRQWLMMAGRGSGKLLALDCPIPTPDGWKRMSDLAAGDSVFDEAGEPCRVTATADGVPEVAYRLHFSDGTSIDACDEHQWVTWTHAERKAYLRSAYEPDVARFPADWPTWRAARVMAAARDRTPRRSLDNTGPRIRTTQQIVDTLTFGGREDTNHCVPVAGPLYLPPIGLPVDPWVLGYWLGNGACRDGSVTTNRLDEAGVRVKCADAGYRSGPRYVTNGDGRDGASTFTPYGLMVELRTAGVLGDQHVPERFLWASIAQREALLAGLMDSDGYCGGNTVEFCSMTRRLADDVMHLARSLGQKPVLGTGRATLNGVDHGEKYRVTWRPTRNPFTLDRKRQALRDGGAQSLRNHHRMIVAAERIDPVPMRCLTVDSPHSMYLAGEAMIPTHNTRTAAEWCLDRAIKYHELGIEHRGALIGPTVDATRDVMILGESGMLACADRRGITADYIPSTRLLLLPDLGSRFQTYSAEKPDQLRGPAHHSVWCVPAGTMVTTPNGPVPIESMKRGQSVSTRTGDGKVASAGLTRRDAPLVEVRHSAGVLRCTPDHRVWTSEHGWVRAEDLPHGATLLGCDSHRWNVPAKRADRPSSSRLRGFGEVAADGVHGTAATAKWTTSNGTASAGTVITSTDGSAITDPTGTATSFTGLCSSTTTDRSRRDGTSTTLTRTQRTTIPPTWPLFPFGITSHPISLVATSGGRRNDAGKNPSEAGRDENRPTTFAPVAGSTSPLVVSGRSTAPPHANRPLTVESVTPVPPADVYDLTVTDGLPEFFADGVLVHNCEEIASMRYLTDAAGNTALTNADFGLRLMPDPRMILTTTPKPIQPLRDLVADAEAGRKGVVITRGSTYENARNLAPQFLEAILARYEGSRLGAQEIHGLLLTTVEGALWSTAVIDANRRADYPDLERIVVAVDPPAETAECGIVVVGSEHATDKLRGHAYVVDDLSLAGSPEQWGAAVVDAYRKWDADAVVAEVNQGGDMVRAIIHAVDATVPVKPVRAAIGKAPRAEPVVAMYELGRIHHVGYFGELESQLVSWVPGDTSPDRLDALVWGVRSLFPTLIAPPSQVTAPTRREGASWSPPT